MYAVIFRAEIRQRDAAYQAMAARMRDLAINEFGCLDFVSSAEGNAEIAISYWPSRAHIQRWKNNPEHRQAQREGRSRWYSAYTVQVVKLERAYRYPAVDTL